MVRQYSQRKNRKLPKGVFELDNGRFYVVIWNRRKKKSCYIGSYHTLKAAHHAYNAEAARLHGDKCVVSPVKG